MTKPIPEGYHSVTPYLAVEDAAKAIDWYKQTLGASEILRFEHGGKIGHAEIKIGDSIVMLSDEWPEGGHLSPKTQGGTTVGLMLYVNDVDNTFRKAVDAGAREDTVKVVDVEEVPLTYLPSNSIRVRIKAVGDLTMS